MKCEKCGDVFPDRKGRFCGTCNWNHPQFVYGESNTMEDFDRRSADVAEMRKELLTGKYSRPTMAEFLGPNHEQQIAELAERMGRDVQYWKRQAETAIREHARTLTQIGADADSLRGYMDRMGKYEKALEQIASQPLEPAHIYEIADRIKLIAKVALEI